jgi:hypothetical protein
MLEANYSNVHLGSRKPEYSIQMMSPGSGKTRILAEWIMQAFANPDVFADFYHRRTVLMLQNANNS